MTLSGKMQLPNIVKLSSSLFFFLGVGGLYLCGQFDLPNFELPTFSLFILLVIATEWFNIVLPGLGTVSVGFAIDFASLLILGPIATSILSIASSITVFIKTNSKFDQMIRSWYKLVFNIGNQVLSVCAAFLTMQILLPSPESSYLSLRVLPVLLLSALVYFLVNSTSVILISSMALNTRFSTSWYKNVRWAIPNHLALFFLGIFLAEMYKIAGILGVLVLLVPIGLARYSFSLFLKAKDSHLGVIQAFAQTLEAKDSYTKGHSDRVARYVDTICRRMRLKEEFIEKAVQAAQMHDIGKIGVPEKILNKNGELTDFEFQLIKAHPVTGSNILKNVDFLNEIAEMIKYHHEWFNGGAGYPNEKSGTSIPLGARILMVADSFDAMTSDRPYRTAMSKSEAIDELIRGKGTQFDPEIVDAFLDFLTEEEDNFVPDSQVLSS